MWAEKEIDEKVQELKKKISRGSLFGLQIDENNINHLILAAYYLGKSEATQEVNKAIEALK